MKEEKKQNKALVLVLGILLALAGAAGLYFGIRALAKSSSEPEATQPANLTTTAEATASETGSATEESKAPVEETPEMKAAKTKPVYTDESITTDDARLDQTVVTCGDYTLNNRDVQIFYTMQYYSFLNEYGMFASMMGIDSSKPLWEQSSMSGDLNWEQYFLMASMEDFQQFAAMATKAAAEGYVLPAADKEQKESVLSGLRESYAGYGYDSADAFVQSNFGPSVRFEDYARYLELYFYAMSYENGLYQDMSVTEEELEEYYNNHPDEFAGIGRDQTDVNVRHILIALNTDADAPAAVAEEAREAAKTKAEELLASFQENPSEEAFAELAKGNSEDPGSKDNGGLYEGVYPGQMVQPFNDWCFDASRQPGDTGIVETSYGFHVMYFVSKSDSYYWKTKAEQSVKTNRMYALVDSVMKNYPVTPDYANIVLCPLPKQNVTG